MRSWIIIFILSLWFGFGWTQGKEPMSLEACLQTGLENNKGLGAVWAKAQGSRAAADQSATSLMPSLKLSAGYSRLSDVPPFEMTIPGFPAPKTITIAEPVLDNSNIKLTLQQPLFTGGRVTGNLKMNRKNYQADSSDYLAQRCQAALNIKTLYWRLYQAQKVKELAEENLRILGNHLNDVGNLLGQGLATENDRLKVKLQMSNARLMLIDAENNRRAIGIHLNNFIGRPLDKQIDPISIPDTSVAAVLSPPELIQKALAERQDLVGQKYRRDATAAGRMAAKSGWYPQVFAVGNYTYAHPNPRIFPAKDQFDATWDAGVMLSMDLWTWQATKHQVRQTGSLLRQAEDRLIMLEDAVRVEVNLALLDVQKAGEKTKVSRSGLDQAQENYRNVNNLFLEGMATNSDLLDAEGLLLQAKVGHAGALVECQIAKDKLKNALGEY
jgi:outer membrane protein TolC